MLYKPCLGETRLMVFCSSCSMLSIKQTSRYNWIIVASCSMLSFSQVRESRPTLLQCCTVRLYYLFVQTGIILNHWSSFFKIYHHTDDNVITSLINCYQNGFLSKIVSLFARISAQLTNTLNSPIAIPLSINKCKKIRKIVFV